MIYKKCFYVFLGLGIIFSSISNVRAISEKKVIFYTGLSALGAVGVAYAAHRFFDGTFKPSEKTKCIVASAISGFFASLFPVILGYVLYKKTPRVLLKKGKRLYEEACDQKMFSSVEKYHNDYKELMEAIDIEYNEHENPLIGAYNDLCQMKELFSDAKKQFSLVKELINSGEVALPYVAYCGMSLEQVEGFIEQIGTFIKNILDSMRLIKKHPDYLNALNVEKQNRIIKKLRNLNLQVSLNSLSRSH